jgi:flagellin
VFERSGEARVALRINTNLPSLTAQRFLSKSQDQLEHSLQAIASGSRIVRPDDDAAGLAISETLRGQMAGQLQSRMNAENAMSLIQVAEGGLNEQNNILIRLRELGIQSASDTVSDNERGYLDQEYQQLTEEFDRIAVSTRFGSKKLLSGEGEEFEFQVGEKSGPENVIKYKLDADTRASAMSIDRLSISDQDDARDTLEDIDEALEKLSGTRADFGAIQSRLQSAQSNLDTQYENIAAAKSRMSDVDVAYESAQLVQAQVLQNAGVGVLAQANDLSNRANRLLGML